MYQSLSVGRRWRKKFFLYQVQDRVLFIARTTVMKNWHRHRQLYALFLLGVVCLWQGGGVAPPDDGSSRDLSPREDRGRALCRPSPCVGRRFEGDRFLHSESHRHANHDNCRSLDSITTTNAMPKSASVLPALIVWVLPAPELLVVPRVVSSRDLYRTAPSHSPPRA